jgi:pantetheine-phosphate adenylyltransferase
MTTAIYPGSFNPWHKGHADVLKKGLAIFQHVVIAQGINPDKHDLTETTALIQSFEENLSGHVDAADRQRISTYQFQTLLVDFIGILEKEHHRPIHAVIRGVRSGYDLEYELQQFYLNEDLGLKIPVILIPCNRNLGHISSSALRGLKMFGREL